MKTLHLSIITIMTIFTLAVLISHPAQGISGSVFFMKSNSTAKLYADFTIPVLNNQSWNLKPEIFTSTDDSITNHSDLTIDAHPSSFTGDRHHMYVTYTLTAKGNTKGVYSLFLFFCGSSPLVVGLNESEVNPAIYNKFFTAVYMCPEMSAGTPDLNIIGYSGIISKTLSISSNGTITVTSVSKLGEPPQTPLKQFKSGILANNVTCNKGLQLIIKTENGSPACVTPTTAQILMARGWATKAFTNMLSAEATDLENSTGIATLGNQTYYFDTPNYTDAVYNNPVQVSFHDVIFTLFPSRFAGGLPANGCGGKYYWANAEFLDGARELLQIFVDSQSCSVRSTPIDLSVHTIPQAGLTFYDGKMKLLVSVQSQVGKDIVLQKPSSDTRPFPICNTNPTKEKLVREKQKILEDALEAEEAKHGGFANRTQNLPWSGIGYDCVDNALEVNILPQYFSADLLPKYFEKIRSIVGNSIDIALSPEGYAVPV